MPSIEQPSADALVTDLAALRWFQRFLGMDIGRIKPQNTVADRAHFIRLCAEHGVPPSAVKIRILTPSVRAALRAGAKKISVDGVWIAFKDGKVATVLLGRQNQPMSAYKVPRRFDHRPEDCPRDSQG